MGCGCGGRKATRTSAPVTTVPSINQNASRLETAQTYQSATIRKAPTGPVGGRKTV